MDGLRRDDARPAPRDEQQVETRDGIVGVIPEPESTATVIGEGLFAFEAEAELNGAGSPREGGREPRY
jgi:hypothetical protein